MESRVILINNSYSKKIKKKKMLERKRKEIWFTDFERGLTCISTCWSVKDAWQRMLKSLRLYSLNTTVLKSLRFFEANSKLAVFLCFFQISPSELKIPSPSRTSMYEWCRW